MLVKLVWIEVISALLAAVSKGVLPKVQHWVPIVIIAVLVPLVSAALTVYRMLIEVGLSADGTDHAPPGTIDNFASGLQMLMVFVPLAVALSALTSFAVLRIMAGRRAQ
jgi:hypothetical protein